MQNYKIMRHQENNFFLSSQIRHRNNVTTKWSDRALVNSSLYSYSFLLNGQSSNNIYP